MDTLTEWARDEFGAADLGDSRRTERLVQVAAQFARRPGGQVTKVMFTDAGREGAFRLVENKKVDPGAIALSTHLATGRRCSERREVLVAVDQTSLTLTDRVGKPGFGRHRQAGTPSKHFSGLQVMSALALQENGTVEGLVGQQWHSRLGKAPDPKRDERPLEERESGLWGKALSAAESVLAETAPETRACFLLDRGADSQAVLGWAADSDSRVIMRSAHPRVLATGGHLHATVRREKRAGTMLVKVSATATRAARTAVLAVRFKHVKVLLQDPKNRTKRTVAMWCVHVAEDGGLGDKINSFYLTTIPVRTLSQAAKIVHAYTFRWRVEEFHRAWKSGVCNVEQSQLRSAEAFKRWATVGAAVAARTERLKSLSRTNPDLPALTELSRDEVDAAIAVSETKTFSIGDDLTLVQVTHLIATIGGYTKSSGGPPGTRTIQRGLEEVVRAARIFQLLRPAKKR